MVDGILYSLLVEGRKRCEKKEREREANGKSTITLVPWSPGPLFPWFSWSLDPYNNLVSAFDDDYYYN